MIDAAVPRMVSGAAIAITKDTAAPATKSPAAAALSAALPGVTIATTIAPAAKGIRVAPEWAMH